LYDDLQLFECAELEIIADVEPVIEELNEQLWVILPIEYFLSEVGLLSFHL